MAQQSIETVSAAHLNSGLDFNIFAPKEPVEKIGGITKETLSGASGDTFRLSQLTAMGANPATLVRRLNKEIVFLTTYAGLKDPVTGDPLGYGAHTGHSEIDRQMVEAAKAVNAAFGIVRLGFASGICDGTTQGTEGMFHSLASRNAIFELMLHQMGGYPHSPAAVGFASCDKEGPATTAAIANFKRWEEESGRRLVGLIVPGGSMLPLIDPSIPDTGKVQATNTLVQYGHLSVHDASVNLCHSCTKTGGGCQFFGTAASQQVIAEAMGLIIPHGACAPSTTAPWLEVAKSSAKYVLGLTKMGIGVKDIMSEGSIRNAVAVMAATGASTNMFMHIPFIARAAGLPCPTVEEYKKIFNIVPRILWVLPNGSPNDKYPRYPSGVPTALFWAAGGTQEIMLALRDLGVLDLDALTVTGKTVRQNLQDWENSPRRRFYRDLLKSQTGVDPDDIILPLDKGVPSTYTFPTGNLAEISVCKSSTINASKLVDGVYHKIGTAKVFTSETELRKAIHAKKIKPDDIIFFVSRGVLATGLEEVYEFTADIKHVPELKDVAIFTDARFSGVSTGACIGHVEPEALSGGPCGKVLDGDLVEIKINTRTGDAEVNLVGDAESGYRGAGFGSALLDRRPIRDDVRADPRLPFIVKKFGEEMFRKGERWSTGYFSDYRYPGAVLPRGY